MSTLDAPPFRADHVGSLLRPPELLAARAAHQAGRLDAEGLREAEDRSIDAVIEMQRDDGLRRVTDGELRRTSWHMDFLSQLEGVRRTEDTLRGHFHNARGDVDFEAPALEVHDRVGLGTTIFSDAFQYLRDRAGQLAAGLRPKLTIPSPSMVYYRGGRPPTMRVTTHLCRGNFRSSWVAQGSYDVVAEALFGSLDVDGFFLEDDDERSGGFEPLGFVPPGTQVVLGLVTTKRGALESPDEPKRRVEQAARFVPIEQLCLSPQCGFSSTVEGNALTDEQQRAKLELVVSAAAEIWG